MSHALPDTSAIAAQTRYSILLLSCATFASMATQRICDAMLPELSRIFGVTIAQAAQVVVQLRDSNSSALVREASSEKCRHVVMPLRL